MKHVARLLMWTGALVGIADACAIAVHFGVAGAPWHVNVALAKLAFIGAGGLMAGGAVVGRLAARREARRLAPSNEP